MNEPRRLRDETTDADIVRLLGSARDDDATREDRLAVAASLGLTLGATSAQKLGHAARDAGSGAWAWAGTPLAKGLVTLAFAAAIGAGASLAWKTPGEGLRTKAAPDDGARLHDEPAEAPPPNAAAQAPLRVPGEAPSGDPVRAGAGSSRATSVQSTPNARIAPPSRATPALAAASADLARETELLAHAKRAIASRSFADATTALDAYDREAPHGVLVPEARALRVRLLVERGARSEAIDGARAFLAAFPASPYAARMRATLRELGDDDGAADRAPAP